MSKILTQIAKVSNKIETSPNCGYLYQYFDELMALLDNAGISVQSGWRRNTGTGETHLYGIPQSKLPGLSQYAQAQDGYLCVLVTGGNQENAVKFLRILCRDMITDPPESEPSPDPQQNGQP